MAFTDPKDATAWFKKVLKLTPTLEGETSAEFRFGNLDFVIDGDWGQGDTSMTFAVYSADCKKEYEQAVANGARPRTPPRDKGDVTSADVFGPGKLVFEFEQPK